MVAVSCVLAESFLPETKVERSSSLCFQGEPIETQYDGDGQLIIDLKQVGVKARNVKWLSVWCTVFERSFGHVVF